MTEEKTNQQQTQQQEGQQAGTEAQGGQSQQSGAKQLDYGAIFGKLDAILDKRSNGIARSALKDDGIEESEVAEIIKAYREHKQSQQTHNADQMQALQKLTKGEVQALNTMLLDGVKAKLSETSMKVLTAAGTDLKALILGAGEAVLQRIRR